LITSVSKAIQSRDDEANIVIDFELDFTAICRYFLFSVIMNKADLRGVRHDYTIRYDRRV